MRVHNGDLEAIEVKNRRRARFFDVCLYGVSMAMSAGISACASHCRRSTDAGSAAGAPDGPCVAGTCGDQSVDAGNTQYSSDDGRSSVCESRGSRGVADGRAGGAGLEVHGSERGEPGGSLDATGGGSGKPACADVHVDGRTNQSRWIRRTARSRYCSPAIFDWMYTRMPAARWWPSMRVQSRSAVRGYRRS